MHIKEKDSALVSITFYASVEQSPLKQIFWLEMRMNMRTQIPPEDKSSAPDLIFSSVKNTLGRGLLLLSLLDRDV
jgi:hypothetical protein